MGDLGGTVGGIVKGFSGPAAPEPQPLGMGGGAGGYTPSATETTSVQPKGVASAGMNLGDIAIGGGVTPAAAPRVGSVLGSSSASPGVIPGTGAMSSFTQAPSAIAPGTSMLDSTANPGTSGTGGVSGDQVKQWLNIANNTSQAARSLYGDLSRGPGASPLMAPRVGGAGAYQPTARRKPLRLSDIMGQR